MPSSSENDKFELVPKLILGIDPGTNLMGYGFIEIMGGNIKLCHHGVIHLEKYENQALKLKKIFERVLGLIEKYHPDELALEAPFFGKNVQSMLKLGRAQGVAMAAALYRDVPIFEYAPRKVKMAVTGHGAASKEKVAGMLMNMLNLKEIPPYFDTTDAVAVAVCHHFQRNGNGVSDGKKHSNWSSFLKSNPGRVQKK